MSSPLVAPDGSLARLEAKARRFAIRANYLVMAVLYLNGRGELRRRFIADPLNLTSETEIGLPANHQMYFIGEYPCGLDSYHCERQYSSSDYIHCAGDLAGALSPVQYLH